MASLHKAKIQISVEQSRKIHESMHANRCNKILAKHGARLVVIDEAIKNIESNIVLFGENKIHCINCVTDNACAKILKQNLSVYDDCIVKCESMISKLRNESVEINRAIAEFNTD